MEDATLVAPVKELICAVVSMNWMPKIITVSELTSVSLQKFKKVYQLS